MKKKISCAWCGKEIWRYPSKMHSHNFCSRKCLGCFSSKMENPEGYGTLKNLTPASENMKRINLKMNPRRMNFSTREKLRVSRLGTGGKDTYAKTFGIHEHRIVAAQKLGRKLRKGEVVHHIDGNKRNNSPENLMVFASQAEHAAWHAAHEKEGDAK